MFGRSLMLALATFLSPQRQRMAAAFRNVAERLSKVSTLRQLPAIFSGVHVASRKEPKPFSTGSHSRGRLFSLSSLMAMSTSASSQLNTPQPIEYFRTDYKPTEYSIKDIYLSFDLSARATIVTATSKIFKQGGLVDVEYPDLVLDGEELELLHVKVNGEVLEKGSYALHENTLTMKGSTIARIVGAASPSFELETQVRINPEKNLALSGLYKSGSNLLCTQCEAMGFRRITFHLDRPDVLTKYRVRLEANKDEYPLLLSNGNQVDHGDLSDNRHWALWDDPFPKPSYLFALVAGSLGSIRDTYTTKSGRVVQLGIFSDKENVGKLDHAMYSIKESMKWDEETFGLECDLDVYNIVATNDFNMGAMENKGLNVFNSAYVLADSKTATDTDYERILGVIAHEYFHNWSGNRVTVRDWFQLTLKEGLTVFRDQWFSSDVTSHAVKRVEDVRSLRSSQFREDQGPMAHPIRPESYVSMDNFYTSTVYNKGAEVVRMYRTLLGELGFKAGLKLYFDRHDGTAVTCDDFRAAMADANNVDLSQFERWYSQAGTPIVDVSEEYDASTQRYTITLRQHTPASPGQPAEAKKPLLIPVVIGLIGSTSKTEILSSTVLRLTQAEESFVFEGITEKPIASILRDFSAPVKLRIEQSDAELAFLIAHDTDSFNRWDAANRLSASVVLNLASKSLSEIESSSLPTHFVDAIRVILLSAKSDGIDLSLVAYALQLPDESTLMQEMTVIDIDRLHAARLRTKKILSQLLRDEFEAVYLAMSASSGEYKFNPQDVARRRLRNTCLDYLSAEGSRASIARAKNQFDTANCMTERIAALGCLVSHESTERTDALATFYRDAGGDALVLNKWFSIQAMSHHPNLLNKVKELRNHPDFIISNPNRARSLISVFAANNIHFHAVNGEGYKFVADCIQELDALNPQVAARLASCFSQWRRFDSARQTLMQQQLERIKLRDGLSKDTFEVVSRCLK